MSSPVSVVIASSGCGHALRGYETFSQRLFDNLRDVIPITLYKGGGRSQSGQYLLPTIRRHWLRWGVGEARSARIEQVSFAVSLLYKAWSFRPDVVIHVSEPWTASFLVWAQQQFRRRFSVLFRNAGAAPVDWLRRFSFIHHNARNAHANFLMRGGDSRRSFFVPNGIDFADYRDLGDKTALRETHGVPRDAFVVLSVGALAFTQKRLDHLVREVARIPDTSIVLMLIGAATDETAEVSSLARRQPPGRCIVRTVPSEDMPAVYGLADLFVHPALGEGGYPFNALLEAVASGLPVLVNDNEDYRELIHDKSWLVDMRSPGALCAAIARIRRNRDAARAAAKELRRQWYRTFDWSCVAHKYVEMYQNVAAQAGCGMYPAPGDYSIAS